MSDGSFAKLTGIRALRCPQPGSPQPGDLAWSGSPETRPAWARRTGIVGRSPIVHPVGPLVIWRGGERPFRVGRKNFSDPVDSAVAVRRGYERRIGLRS